MARTGLAADIGGWMRQSIKPVDELPVVKDKLMEVSIHDRNALGARGKDVTLGTGAGTCRTSSSTHSVRRSSHY